MKNKKINVFIDTEFNFTSNELISLAMVSEDGKIFNKTLNSWKEENCNNFVKKFVLPLLPDKSEWLSKEEFEKELQSFILNLGAKPELWGWFCAYDLVVIHKTLGKDIDKLPFWMPYYINDFRGVVEGDSDFRFSPNKFYAGPKHYALNDALALRQAFIARKQYRNEVGNDYFKFCEY